MTLADRIREFVAGPSAVSMADQVHGIPADVWSPSEYGDYLATSNHVYTCVSRRAELLARLPLRVYRDDEEVEAPLLATPNPVYDGAWLRELTQYDMDLWGRAFWFLERDGGGVREMWRVRPDRVTVVPDRHDYIKGYMLSDIDGGAPTVWDAEDVVYFRYPNPIDELSGLSPVAAARLAADTATDAMKSNRQVFVNGNMAAAKIQPTEGDQWTKEQAADLEKDFDRRMRGVDKAHRWAIFRTRVEIERLGFSPKDVQHLETMRWSLEEVARAYRFPLDLLRGEVTYENQDAAMRSVYTHGVIPAAWRMANIITASPVLDDGLRAEFDTSGIEVLQENRAEIVEQIRTLAEKGVPLNKLLSEFMPHMLPDGGSYAWGDVAWLSSDLVPVDSPELVVAPSGTEPMADAPIADDSPAEVVDEETDEAAEEELEAEDDERTRDFGGTSHLLAWNARVDATDPMEDAFAALLADLFHAQRKSILAKLENGASIDELFDMARWVREFRVKARPLLLEYAEAGYDETAADNPGRKARMPSVFKFIARRAQRFATRVNHTTWLDLKTDLAIGIKDGEGVREQAKRVDRIMGMRIRSSAKTIARTEVVGAYNGGSLIAAKDIGARHKVWNSAIVGARDSHIDAHSDYRDGIPIGDDFRVGKGKGPAPGQMRKAEEDINCRCWLTYKMRP